MQVGIACVLQSAIYWVGAGGGEGHNSPYHTERPKVAFMT